MGQYWLPVNLDKKEWFSPHKIGCPIKQQELLGTTPGVGDALLLLLFAHKEVRGGGDIEINEHTKPVVGRWAGDRVVLVGDYAQDDDFTGFNAKESYEMCDGKTGDISALVAKAMGHVFEGEYVTRNGITDFKANG